MARVSPIQNSFNAGELSPQLRGRFDLDKYKNGCEVLENFLPQVFGPAQKRPGTRFVRATANSAVRSRLIPFEFSATQAFAVEFGDETVRFYADGGVILNGGSPYQIASPYSADVLPLLSYAQSADVVYLVHPAFPPYKLARLGTTNWTLTEVAFTRPPFGDLNATATTLATSGTTGTITVTASASLFTAADVGVTYSTAVIPEAFYTKWAASTAVTAGNQRQYEGRVYTAVNTGTTGTRPPLHNSGTESDGSVSWTYVGDGTGYFRVTGFTSATSVTATVIQTLPATTATTRWARSAWSDTDGWPRAVAFYEDRLWFGGNDASPQTLWASVVGDYENFTYGTNDDDALNYAINTQDLNTITWLSSGKVLAIGTTSGEFTINGNQISDPITPTSVRITPQTTFGCTGEVRPLRIASSILFVQRSGRKIREYTYNFDIDGYTAPNVTLLAEHITVGGVADITYQQEPSQIVWAVRNDGKLLGMTYERAEDVVGWHRHDLGGEVESVISLPHWDGDQDVLWLIVKRVVNGNTVRYVEYMEKYLTDDHAFFVDCGLTYDGTPTTTIAGLGHLEGKEVAILTDGAVHPRRTVTGGSITLQLPSSVVVVGLPYVANLKTMPIEAGSQDGVAQGKTQRIHNLTIRLFQTGPGLLYGPDEDNLDQIYLRSSNEIMGQPVQLFTGDTDYVPFPGQYQQGAQIMIRHQLPLPCTVVALMPQMVTYDR
jgi:hypothetical protein